MKSSQKQLILGIVIGFLAPQLILFGVKVYEFPDMSFILFLRTGFSTGVISPWLKIATLFNLAPFFLLLNANRMRSAQGVLLATIVYGLIIAYLTFR